jgi:hypothetical protein
MFRSPTSVVPSRVSPLQLLALLPVLCVAGIAPAQSVPWRQAVVSVISNVAPSEGIWFVDRATGSSVPITGLLAAGSPGNGISAIAMDPVDDRIWLGGINNNGNTGNQLNWIRCTGTAVTQWTQFATVAMTTSSSINAILFDDNGNPVFCGGTAAGQGGVFRADRRTGGAATLIGAVASGTHNALAKDSAGNLYVGMFGNGQIHQLVKNPDGSFQPPAPWGTVTGVNIFGLAFAPADGVHPDQLFVVVGGPASPLVSVIPVPAGGAGTAVATTQTLLNWVEYDRRQNDLLSVQSAPDRMTAIARGGGDAVVASIGNTNIGTPTALDANDGAEGELVVVPALLNGGVGPFDLEVGMTAPPGSLALIALSAPFVDVLTLGVPAADGRLVWKLPNLALLGPLPPATLQFTAAWFDTGFNLQTGAPVSWPTL